MQPKVKPFRQRPTCCPEAGSMSICGYFRRRSDGKVIKRWRCGGCKKTRSNATGAYAFAQKKRHINNSLSLLLNSGVSQRRSAHLLGIDKKTVSRKFLFLAQMAKLEHEKFLQKYKKQPIKNIQFDEMESFEHTKLKPLSIALAVNADNRHILSARVCVMPAKGHLAKISVKKYGRRPEHRGKNMKDMLKELSPYVAPSAIYLSDQNPRYPKWLKTVHPNCKHRTVKGRRGCIVGQGELKKIGFDPLFSLNHTCAMIRDNINRMRRKTWATTKKLERLQDHLMLYIVFHNRMLINSD